MEQKIEFIKAMNKLQGELIGVAKNAKAHNYTYSNLGQVVTTLYPVMTKHGFAVTQMLCTGLDGKAGIETTVYHVGGHSVSGAYPLEKVGMKGVNAAQDAGAGISYGRRYALAAAFGLAVFDNDAATTPPKPVESRQENAMVEIKNATGPKDLQAIGKAYQANANACGWLESLVDSINARKAELKEAK